MVIAMLSGANLFLYDISKNQMKHLK